MKRNAAKPVVSACGGFTVANPMKQESVLYVYCVLMEGWR